MNDKLKQVPALLERLIDENGLCAVVHMLAGVCRDKEDHILSDCQDARTARLWNQSADALDHAANNVAVLRVSQ